MWCERRRRLSRYRSTRSSKGIRNDAVEGSKGWSRRLSPTAAISFGFALLWLAGVGDVLAILFGVIAIQQIHDSQGRLSGKGIALAAILIGICSLVATVVVGAALLLGNS